MFTGIIRAMTKVEKVFSKNESLFFILAKPSWKLKAGQSIATDGACLTVARVNKKSYIVELMPETLRKTKYSRIVPPKVNLEKSLGLTDLLDGHIVQGHIDTVGKITGIRNGRRSSAYKIRFPKKFAGYVADKGSVALDGVSLTIVKADNDSFTVALVDYTLKNTTLGERRVGDLVNIEFDILAKYLSRQMKYAKSSKS